MDIRSCYAESKRISETMCVAWKQQHDVPFKIVRMFHTYGPGINLKDGRIFADFVSDVLNNRNITMKSDGMSKRCLCYISDTILGFFTIMLKGKFSTSYNLGNPKAEISVLELANTLSMLFPNRSPNIIFQKRSTKDKYPTSTINRSIPSIEKIKKLGWEPKITIEEGFKRTIKSMLQEN